MSNHVQAVADNFNKFSFYSFPFMLFQWQVNAVKHLRLLSNVFVIMKWWSLSEASKSGRQNIIRAVSFHIPLYVACSMLFAFTLFNLWLFSETQRLVIWVVTVQTTAWDAKPIYKIFYCLNAVFWRTDLVHSSFTAKDRCERVHYSDSCMNICILICMYSVNDTR